jgi:hypothetical protein
MSEVFMLLSENAKEIRYFSLQFIELLLICQFTTNAEEKVLNRRIRTIPRFVLRLAFGRATWISKVFLKFLGDTTPPLLSLLKTTFSDVFAFEDNAVTF